MRGIRGIHGRCVIAFLLKILMYTNFKELNYTHIKCVSEKNTEINVNNSFLNKIPCPKTLVPQITNLYIVVSFF